MADKPATPLRPMRYPYTFTAKLAQFPYKYYFNNNWIVRFSLLGFVVCMPLFKSISNLSNSPENVSKWAEIRRKEAEGHH